MIAKSLKTKSFSQSSFNSLHTGEREGCFPPPAHKITHSSDTAEAVNFKVWWLFLLMDIHELESMLPPQVIQRVVIWLNMHKKIRRYIFTIFVTKTYFNKILKLKFQIRISGLIPCQFLAKSELFLLIDLIMETMVPLLILW